MIQVLTSQFLLPFHLVEHFFSLVKEIRNFRSLIITFRSVKYFVFRIRCEIFTNFGYGEYNLLQCAIVAYNLRKGKGKC